MSDPREITGCACPRTDARECLGVRNGSDHRRSLMFLMGDRPSVYDAEDERCECDCHDAGDDDDRDEPTYCACDCGCRRLVESDAGRCSMCSEACP